MRPIQLEKKGIRGLAIAESFAPSDTSSTLAGIVYRNDGIVDGFVFGKSTILGKDATQVVTDMYSRTKRQDIRYIMIWGSIISRYNMVDVREVSRVSGVPVLALSGPGRKDIERTISNILPDRISLYKSMPKRLPVLIHNNHTIYVRTFGCTIRQARMLLNRTTICGSVPEPVRIARLLASSLALGGGSSAIHIQDGSSYPRGLVRCKE